MRNYPWYRDWQDSFEEDGLVVLGVHTPETKAERELGSVKEKASQEGFTFPIVVDNDKTIWNTWGNSMWPSVYLIDKSGRLRYWWYGELNWNEAGGQRIMGEKIKELLAEKYQPAF